ncbi:MAG: hypothetical protein RLY93_01560 [Sumerlaeia bacterium]
MTAPSATIPAADRGRFFKTQSALPAFAAVFLLVAGALAYVFFVGLDPDRKPPRRAPMTFVLPAGFSGEIKVLYEVEGAPPLPVDEAGHVLLDIPPSGRLETSSPLEYGQSADDLFLRELTGGGTEELNIGYLKRRVNGLEGDSKEFFHDPEQELPLRRQELEQQGRLDASGNVIKPPARPYQIVVVRDDFGDES